MTYLEQGKEKNSHQRLILHGFGRISNGRTRLPQRFPKDGSPKLLVIAPVLRTPRDHQSHRRSSQRQRRFGTSVGVQREQVLEMALDRVGMAGKKHEVEEKGTDGLLLGEIVEHPGDGFIGGIAFSGRAGRVSAGVDNGPFRRGGIVGRCRLRWGGELWAFILLLLLPLGLPPDCFGLIPQDEVESGNVARALAFGVDALRAGRDGFVTLGKGETEIWWGRAGRLNEASRAHTLIFRFLQFWQPALGLP